jgi:hypothetical protein
MFSALPKPDFPPVIGNTRNSRNQELEGVTVYRGEDFSTDEP